MSLKQSDGVVVHRGFALIREDLGGWHTVSGVSLRVLRKEAGLWIRGLRGKSVLSLGRSHQLNKGVEERWGLCLLELRMSPFVHRQQKSRLWGVCGPGLAPRALWILSPLDSQNCTTGFCLTWTEPCHPLPWSFHSIFWGSLWFLSLHNGVSQSQNQHLLILLPAILTGVAFLRILNSIPAIIYMQITWRRVTYVLFHFSMHTYTCVH